VTLNLEPILRVRICSLQIVQEDNVTLNLWNMFCTEHVFLGNISRGNTQGPTIVVGQQVELDKLHLVKLSNHDFRTCQVVKQLHQNLPSCQILIQGSENP